MRKFYEENAKFKSYVDKYCEKNKVSPEFAFQDAIVKSVYEVYVKEADTKRASEIKINAGCGGAEMGECK